MDIIKLAIERPIAVVAAVLMAVMFGYVSLVSIPIQLAPDVEKPVISIETSWPGAAPAETERELTIPQEDVFKGLDGLEEITSSSSNGSAEIDLEFAVGTDMNRALLLVANRLDRVGDYPEEASEPTLSTSGSQDNAIAWFVIKRDEPSDEPIHTLGEVAEDTVQDRLQRVQGVARVDIFGGSDQQLQVIIDPSQLARYQLTIPDIVSTLRTAGVSMSAGDIEEAKRNYVVRTEGDFETPEQVRSVVLRTSQDNLSGRLARVTVGDIATVRYDYAEPRARIRVLGEPALVARAIRETGANVIETMKGVREAVDELNDVLLDSSGLNIKQVYDETDYIDSAINLVTSNIYIGGTLAALILLLFLRSIGATFIISVAIPVSVIASFVAMAAMGRSINVISLAGIAFAVGMVVDAAIVVLENIYRHRQNGHGPKEAAYKGASQVWGAILVSALTTVMVFIPVLVMELVVGQLFRDIAVAISVSVILSLLVSVTLIPAMANRVFASGGKAKIEIKRLPVIDDFARWFSNLVTGYARAIGRSATLAALVVTIVSVSAASMAYFFLPKLEYLPEGNRNLVFGFILPPPGYNLATMTDIAQKVEEATKPYWDPEPEKINGPDEPVQIERFFFVAFNGSAFLGGSAIDPQRASEMIPIMSQAVFQEPGTFGFIRQPSIFGRGIGGARSIDLNITGPELETILATALKTMGLVSQAMPRSEGHQFRPDPGLELGAPEVRLFPDRLLLSDAGISVLNFAQSVDVFNDGLRIKEITQGSKRIDLILKGEQGLHSATQDIETMPIVTQTGIIVPASALARVEVTAGPTEIKHLERKRAVTIRITPAPDIALEEALTLLNEQVVSPLRSDGLPPGVQLTVAGTADELTETFNRMKLDLVLALVIVFLVMAVLFESFIYPLIIMFSVPLAAAGGALGLFVLNQFTFQALDMLTLLGFVILVGIVVNNAILLVHQALLLIKEEGMVPNEAIVESTKNRLRPIFMSTLTSVFGMLPLVLFPGAGSELYRGLGSVVVGGLSLSAVLTLLLIPPLLALAFKMTGHSRLTIGHKKLVEQAAE